VPEIPEVAPARYSTPVVPFDDPVVPATNMGNYKVQHFIGSKGQIIPISKRTTEVLIVGILRAI
jgi:hypothetical protein